MYNHVLRLYLIAVCLSVSLPCAVPHAPTPHHTIIRTMSVSLYFIAGLQMKQAGMIPQHTEFYGVSQG